MKEMQDKLKPLTAFVKAIRKMLLKQAAQCPALAITLVILVCTFLLPLVTATALSPLVAIFYFWGYLQSKGLSSVLCAVCFQGALLTSFIFATFGIVFLVTSGANILFSKYYTPITPIKRKINVNFNFQRPSQQRNANFALF